MLFFENYYCRKCGKLLTGALHYVAQKGGDPLCGLSVCEEEIERTQRLAEAMDPDKGRGRCKETFC